MKLAFPVLEDRGLDSPVNGHWGGTDTFVLVDTDAGSVKTLDNPSKGGHGGPCTPLAAFAGEQVDGVCVIGIGGGAIAKLASAGVKVYRAVAPTVGPNVAALKAGTLPLLGADSACAGHGGGCGGH